MGYFKFPDNFTWGVAASAYQIEGAWNEDNKGLSIWDTFCHTPGKIAHGETGDIATDHYHRYKEDIALMADLAIKAYRFSISWSRVLPQGVGAVNQKGLSFYDRVVDELLKHGIEPYVNLFHYDLPQALQDRGGWPERQTAYAFSEYAQVVAKCLSDRVRFFITHNEPWVTAAVGYMFGEHAPGVKDPIATIKAIHHLLLSHGLAAEAVRSSAKQPVAVGIVLNLYPVYPASNSRRDVSAADRMHTVINRAVLDPLLKGTTPIQEFSIGRFLASSLIKAGDLEKIHTCDFLGVNYYTRMVVKNAPKIPILAMEPVYPVGNEYSGMWEIFPKGLYEILKRVWKEYLLDLPQPPKLMVTENGIPVPDGLDFDHRIRDERRIRYLKAHITEVQRAIQDGIPVEGYFHWSFMDNFEWALGYSQRYGLVYVDFTTQKRTVKDSGYWFKNIILNNGLTDEQLENQL